MAPKAKRILLLCGNYFPAIGGTEQECRNLAKQFKKDGHSCTVLTADNESLPSYELIDGIPVYRKIRGWHLYETTYIIFVFLLLFKLRKSFDQVICFGLKRFTAPAVIFCRLFNKKVFFRVESPGSFNQTLDLRYGKLIYKISRSAHGAVVFTKEILSILDKMDFPKDRITWIPNSVDTDLFSPETKAPDAPVTFCFAGRLVKIKGLETFIAALGKLIQTENNFKALIIGDGELKDSLLNQAEKLGLAGRISFIGYTGNVASYYKKSDVFVLPSLSEGMPLAMLEAMSSGLCCVGSNVGGIKELAGEVDENAEGPDFRVCHQGILFPSGNSEVLYQTLKKVMNDPELRKRLAENARKFILSNNAVRITAQRYIDLIDKQE